MRQQIYRYLAIYVWACVLIVTCKLILWLFQVAAFALQTFAL